MAVWADAGPTPVSAPLPRKRWGELLRLAVLDLGQGLAKRQLWSAIAWEEIKTTYRRSLFGALWIAVSFAAFVGAKLLVFIPIMRNVDGTYYSAYLLLGFFAWQYIIGIVGAAPTVFTASENWIKSDALPLSVYAYKQIVRNLFNFALTGVVVLMFLAILRQSLSWHALLVIPAMLAFVVNAVWVTLLLGVICTRFRDLTHLTQTIMRMMFFLTPIFWMPEQMGELMRYLWWNPFSHFLWIFRTPLIDHEPALASWAFVGVITVAGWAVTMIVFAAFRRRIVFWF
jgi:ABC-type polysaccharide/polyol phosphate export permease